VSHVPVRPVDDYVALKAIVCGRVQGVYFRAFVTRLAIELALTGYVRNLPDGSVQVYAEGDRQQLEELLSNLNQGPPGARVDSVSASWVGHTGKYHDFSVTG
jgi:acylphosphatase